MKFLRKLAVWTVAAGLVLGSAGPASAMTFLYGRTPIDLRMDALQEMIEEIRANYKDETTLDQIFIGIYKGLFSGLGDPWSSYVTPLTEDDLYFVTQNVEEAYEGIGVTIRQSEQYGVWITSVVSGSPAQEAGLRYGDTILKVGPQDVSGMTAAEVGELIRGASGSTVTLTIDRDGEVMNFDVKRRVIRTDTVSGEMLNGGIAYIKISSFSLGTADAFADFYDSFAAQGAKGVVLDLRGNGGGAVAEAIDVADHLIHTNGRISEFERQGEIFQTVYSSADEYADLPVVCLTDRDTASASELLAAAPKDRDEAVLVGETTYGKGVAQFVGGAVRDDYFTLSIYYFLSPNGRRIDGAGVQPDVAVSRPAGKSKEEIAAIREGLAPINEEKKYYAGQTGLNVYGVQQRLAAMGYDVKTTGVMDVGTVSALKVLQAEAGACPYGGLDYCTLEIVRDKFDAWCYPGSDDAALAKAVELLRGE